MSYTFDGSNDRMKGTFTGTFANARTMACFVKITDHPIVVDCIYTVAAADAVDTDTMKICSLAVDNQFAGQCITATPQTLNTTVTLIIDGVWTPMVFVYTSNVLKDFYIAAIGNTAQTTTDRTIAAVQFIQVGENIAGGSDFPGSIAEVAFWNAALTTQQITDYLSGVSAATIQAANLQGYWPLSTDNTTQANEGLDSGGDLTVTSALFSADHPTITGASSAKRRRTSLMGIG